jgi:hypothetical protein
MDNRDGRTLPCLDRPWTEDDFVKVTLGRDLLMVLDIVFLLRHHDHLLFRILTLARFRRRRARRPPFLPGAVRIIAIGLRVSSDLYSVFGDPFVQPLVGVGVMYVDFARAASEDLSLHCSEESFSTSRFY